MATKYWQGDAANIAQVDTITVADTWATSDTVTLTINGNDIVCTVGTSATTAAVAELIAAAINASDALTDAAAGSYNVGGQSIPEFAEVSASFSGSVVTVTGRTPGKPFVLSVTENTVGSGTATEATATAATGQNFWSNADNWSGGSVPANGDEVVFENSSVDVLYGLPTTLEMLKFTVNMSYTGRIGLPPVNADGALPYAEYRTRYPVFKDVSAAASKYVIGQGSGTGPKLVNIKHDSASGGTYTNGWADITVYDTGQAPIDGQRVVNISTGSDTSDHVLRVLRGSVAVGVDGETARLLTADIGASGSGRAADVYFGNGTTLVGVEAYAGDVRWGGATTTAIVDGATATIEGDGTQASLTVRGGECRYAGNGTVTSLVNSGGIVDFDRGTGSMTVSACELYADYNIRDNQARVTWSAGLDLHECANSSNLQIGKHRRLTPGAIS